MSARFHIDKQHRIAKSRTWLILLMLPIVLILIAAFSAAYWYQSNLQPVSDKETEIIVSIPEGASAREIGELLESKGVIRSSTAFDWYTGLNDFRGKMQAGGYRFSTSYSVKEIVARLVAGDVASDLVIVLPAQRIDELKATFIGYGYSNEEVEAAFKPETYAAHPVLAYKPAEASMEGYIYPDSYQRTDRTALTEIVSLALDELNASITEDMKRRFAESGLSVHEAITLASIVESEVPASSGDRPTVAQIYLKRLRDGMLLQADPTALYGKLLATGTTDGWRQYDTPYNTYMHSGLPPGPISNVSASSLQAVAYPTDTDYVYFVSGDDDNNYFASTLSEHEANIAAHCKKKCGSY